MAETEQVDLSVYNAGSLYTVTPETETARIWLQDHVPADALYFGRGLAVEPRYLDDLLAGAEADGLTVR